MREARGEDDQVPGVGSGGGRHDHAIGPEVAGALCQAVGCGACTGELVEGDAEILGDLRAAQVDDAQPVDLDAPQPSALVGGIDRAAGGGCPLGPDGRRLERRVQRPGLTGTVIAALGDRRPVRRKGRCIEAGLPVNPAAEPADRAQT